MGYEPVLFERGHVPYGKDDPLEEYCYREINSCDILVAIIGGKYGTQSMDQRNSITQRELKSAVDLGKQIYVFVEKSVHSEYRTYIANKNVSEFKPTSVNDLRGYNFLEEVYSLPGGNPVEPFELSEDIVKFLKEQWAGLFQRLLQESARQKEVNIIEGLKATAATLNHLVTFLTEERSKGDQAIKDILLSTHPAFEAIKSIARIPYRVVFYTYRELQALLSVRSFVEDLECDPSVYEWDHEKLKFGIRINRSIFDESGHLKVITPEEWDSSWIQRYPHPSASEDNDDFDISDPFA